MMVTLFCYRVPLWAEIQTVARSSEWCHQLRANGIRYGNGSHVVENSEETLQCLLAVVMMLDVLELVRWCMMILIKYLTSVLRLYNASLHWTR